ncbi:phosphatase PAP2 family protein [Diaphorobacter sp. HDW4A]|uniref:phosphatase PAP2 family protein n=1 Tax=Diaphorobacter sp. HDW4A TaxID=2714924 RepID=UPI0014096366|nr:phosphatase PAP2 family protein [Diaphorobacter sp. HDW4A]QIL79882.1 phosphatase PAP2 family protein [Diaphorobacter sp. HDW4A]
MTSWTPRRLLGLTVFLFLLVALWDFSGLDLPLARLFGSADGFALRSRHWFVVAFHEIPRTLSSVVVVALLIGIFKPWSFLKRLGRRERIQLVVSVLGGMLLITLLKKANYTSCPWDVNEFGGRALYVSHWALGVRDLGPGHCFPAGHASSAFGFLAGWFVVRRLGPQVAVRWLVAAMVLGLALGVAQQLRGAHYMSHTLWTAWICWTFGFLVDMACKAYFSRRDSAQQTTTAQEVQA